MAKLHERLNRIVQSEDFQNRLFIADKRHLPLDKAGQDGLFSTEVPIAGPPPLPSNNSIRTRRPARARFDAWASRE